MIIRQGITKLPRLECGGFSQSLVIKELQSIRDTNLPNDIDRLLSSNKANLDSLTTLLFGLQRQGLIMVEKTMVNGIEKKRLFLTSKGKEMMLFIELKIVNFTNEVSFAWQQTQLIEKMNRQHEKLQAWALANPAPPKVERSDKLAS